MKQQFTYSFLITLFLFCSCGKTNKPQGQVNKPAVKTDTINWKNQKQCFDKLDKYDIDTSKWELVKLNFYKSKTDNKVYYLTCEADWGPVFSQLEYDIDFNTYTDFGEYASDLRSVFYFYLMSDGLKIIRLDTCDPQTFKTFGSTQYARDKRFIYWRGEVIKNADLETFSVLDFKSNNPTPPLARDKNNLYIWDKVLTDTSQIEGLEEFLRTR